jgi:hypothetical protein
MANKRRNSDLIPRFYRTDSNKKFIQATLDQLTQPGSIKKVNGYIGRQNAKSSTGKDIFVSAIDNDRKNYQLEPSLVVKDELGNIDFYKDYIDYINQLSVLGAKVDNHERLNKQEFYSWNPHINWDKFVNFQQYYWLPYGPTVIDIYGQQRAITSTYTIHIENEGNSKQYLFTPNGLTRNPVIKLYRGQTYHFEIESPGEPFSIKTAKTVGEFDRYNWGTETTYAVESGTITFTVPDDAPNVLYYTSENDANIGNIFKIYNIKDNTEINVENEMVGKKTYKLSNGTPLSNGMKLRFNGDVTPAKYADDLFYVEGVGDKISLIAERDLEIISGFSDSIDILFDDSPFDRSPFEVANSYAGKKDYIVINRSSKDRNPWSRYNRWFHKDVIETSARLNGEIADIDQTTRAVRPIIEFNAGLKLFNAGLEAILDIDLLDTVTTDAFSEVEGQLSYAIDAVPLSNGHRVVFAADTDILVRNKIYRVEFIEVTPPSENRRRQIRLVEESSPVLNQTALIKYGRLKQGLMYWFNGTTWVVSQTKETVNQPPLFDVVDDNYYSFGDKTIYDGSTFIGTKLFSYSLGAGSSDTELGFALDYKNINNVGDILFNFNLLSDSFTYKTITDVNNVNLNTGSLVKSDGLSNISYTNGWEISKVANYQPVIRIYKNSNLTNNFNIDVYNNKNDLNDLVVRVYVNGKRVDAADWSIETGPKYKKVVLTTDIAETDVLTIKSFAKQPKNNNGYYEIPVNLQNNPLNNNISEFTLGEVIDHVDSIIDNLTTFSGVYPGVGNLRDLGNISPYGTRFLQHSGALPLAIYHITSKNANVVKAVQKAQDDYGKFKRQFMLAAESLGLDLNIPSFVDAILTEVNKNNPKTFPYYFSDMVPFGAATRTEITVVDYRTKYYPLSTNFNMGEVSPSAVLIYVNDQQLCYGVDYTFDGQGFVIITYSELANDDIIAIVEYETTDGSFVPPTPTKLGLWPKFQPLKYLDTTLVTPQEVIQGHDGSLILAYGDYRDDLILELEKRIFNNIKFDYNADLFDVNDYLPRYIVDNSYSLNEFNEVLSANFYKWTKLVDRDFTKPLSYDRLNPFTFNYRSHQAPDGRETPGYWRGIYKWLYDTDRPHLCPWEMIGFSIMPAWWETQYGPAPYTSDNLVMWQDISEGVIRDPNAPIVRNPKYVRPFLMDCIPATENGELKDPMSAGVASGVITTSSAGDFVFGDCSPVEAAWRRSSYYPFAVISTLLLTYPADVIGRTFDRARIYRDPSGQFVYKDTKTRIRLADLVLPNIYSDTVRIQTSGLVNYIIDHIQSDNLKSITQYKSDLQNLNLQLSYRVGSFTEKEKFNLILDSKNPTAVGGVFVPQENYSIIFNTSSPVKKLVYSGVIITKLSSGYEVKGYSQTTPYFYYYPWTRIGYTVNVGGISESYSQWTAGQQYVAGKVVQYSGVYYRVQTTHTATSGFDTAFYQKLSALPIVGGRDAFIRTAWDKTEVTPVAYGTKFRTIQEVVDFLLGYGEYLKDQGFVFDDFNNNLGAITDWVTAAKEFLFWTTQNWSSGEDKYVDWLPSQDYEEGVIVTYNGDYYVVQYNHNSGLVFDETKYKKLSELSTIGASVIALSPSANGLIANLPYCVIEDIKDQFNGYEFFKADGEKLEPEFVNSFRENNTIKYSPSGNEGIFGATFYLVQKEHALLADNNTLFNDTIYDPTTGYRQEKIKISGYISTDWFGGFDVPGFIYDEAVIKNWTQWTDYNLGDIVKYKEFYYSANSFLTGSMEFVAKDWIKLANKPTSKLLPNWSYKAEQFTDFYSLDSDNFDVGQQKMAQHLIGYQKRQYLENIIQDDISEYKFYQGMIIEKGTQNVLNKLFDVLSADDKESIKFFEEWAVRVGQYGTSKAYEEIEFELDESLFKLSPQPIELVNVVDPKLIDFAIRQTPNDVYLKPLDYNSTPWPTKETYTSYLRTPGYVRTDEVAINIDTLDEIVNQDITKFTEGSYIHCAFEGRDWNVYRLTKTNFNIVGVSYNKTTKVLTLTTDVIPQIPNNDIIGILHENSIQGFHKIDSISLTTITINKEFKDFPDPNTIDPAQLLVYKITTQRVDNINNASSIIPERLKTKERLWVDNNGNNKWAVYEHANVYSSGMMRNPRPFYGASFGQAVAVDANVSVAAVSNSANQVITYERGGYGSVWTQRQTLSVKNVATLVDGEFGQTIEYSPNKRWLVVGSPRASNVKTQYKGTWSNSSTYVVNDVVQYSGAYYKALQNVIVNQNPSTATTYWIATSLIPASTGGISSGLTSQGMITIYEGNANGEYALVADIPSPTPSATEFFGSKITFADNNTMLISAIGYNPGTPNDPYKGKVYQFNYATDWALSTTSFVGSAAADKFGYDVVVSSDGNYMAISAPENAAQGGFVRIYKLTNGAFVQFYTIFANTLSLGEQFGLTLSITNDGSYIAVGSRYADDALVDQGKVFVFELVNNEYVLYQTIESRNPESGEQFGAKVGFMNNDETLVIFSQNGDTNNVFTFDDDTTTFDGNTMKILDTRIDSGRVDVYDRYDTNWVYSESISPTVDTASVSATGLVEGLQYIISVVGTTDFTAIGAANNTAGTVFVATGVGLGTGKATLIPPADGFGTALIVRNDHIIISSPNAVDRSYVSGKIYDYSKEFQARSWTVLHEELPVVNLDKIKKVFLYNKKTNELVTYLDIIDPLQGNIAGIAEQELKFKTFYDPATYTVGTDEVNVDDGMAWTDKNVGMLWWDMSRAKFIDYNNGDVVYRNTTWNKLYDTASIDVYEWVESSLLPSAWDELADTEEGLSSNISGTSLYGDSVYSYKERYDNIARILKKTYYFWVKNKTVVPDVPDRRLSANTVANLIADPKGQGLQFIAFTGANSFSLANVLPSLNHTDINLAVEYWLIDKYDINSHSQWRLISNDSNSSLPTSIEEKLIDSLCGKDKNDRVVPDFTLAPKLRYGIENRPRQGMFINRVEALKQYLERVNSVLIQHTIVEERDLSDLDQYETEPNTTTGLYDIVKDTDAELRFIGTSTFRSASVTPKIVNGKITGINIIESGRGYINAPYIDVTGKGINAKLRTTLNDAGEVVGAYIFNPGEGYSDDTTTLTIRSLSTLVHSDTTALGNWSIYSYDTATRVWSRIRSQNYDVRKYWEYADWYATGYSQFTLVDFSVEAIYLLPTLEVNIGQIVKVNNVGTGGWLLLEKYATVDSVDYTQSYAVVGRQGGTIQIKDNLYRFRNSNLGYDGPLFDGDIYDNTASTEVRVILTALKDKILIDNLKQDYLDAFFACIRYAFNEQTYIDWIFKTSFVRAQHNVGPLKEKVTYNNDSLSDFEDYVNEVKPYRTKVREFVSAYDRLEPSYSLITDFDLQSTYLNKQLSTVEPYVVNGEVVSVADEIDQYPWKNWKDNVGFKLTDIVILNGGSGYLRPPLVKFEGGYGSGATAKAYISQGKVNRITLLTTGSGYFSVPTIILDGGLSETGVAATAIATIGNSVVRSNYVRIKFDRTSGQYYITKLQETETLTAISNSQVQFNLKWSPTSDILDSSVKVNGVDLIRGTYTLSTKKSVTRGYTSYSGLLTLDTAPGKGAVVNITYIKDFNYLSAADRINWYYNPETNELGKDLTQLMQGVDYGGVQIIGLGFDVSQGWESAPWYTDGWDSQDTTFDDYIVTVDTTITGGSFVVGTNYRIYFQGTTNWLAVGAAPTAEVVGAVSGTSLAVIDTVSGVLAVDQQLIGEGIIPGTKITEVVGPLSVSTTSITSTTSFFTVTLSTALPATPVAGMTFTIDGAFPDGYNDTWTVDVGLSPTQFRVVSTLSLGTATVQGTVSGVTYYSVSEEHEDPTAVIDIAAIALNTVFVATDIGEGTGIVAPVTNTFTLPYVPVVGEEINVYYKVFGTDKFFRIDDISYIPVQNVYDGGFSSTVEILNILEGGFSESIMDGEVDSGDSAASQAPTVVVMSHFVGDGVTNTITVPGTLMVNTGDTFIFRKSTSDGSIKVQEADYDTALSGGQDLNGFIGYQTATGLAADDIIIDGDDLVSTNTSHGPEECVPGQIVDTLAVKVTTRPTSGSASINYNNYVYDGVVNVFRINQDINSKQAVLVLFSDKKQPLIIDEDFTVDYKLKEVTLLTLPAIDEVISIITFGFSGEDLLDLDYFVSNGSANEFITSATWSDTLSAIVYVNGEIESYELFKTDASYDKEGVVGIRFAFVPPPQAIINYVISSSGDNNFSVMKSETFVADGSDTYQLTNPVGTSLPLENNILVYQNYDSNTEPAVYRANSSTAFTILEDQLEYVIPRNRFLPYGVNVNEISVTINDVPLKVGNDYLVDASVVSITLRNHVYGDNIGNDLMISVNRNSSYTCNGTEITFVDPPAAGTKITVVSFYKHEFLGIDRADIVVTIDSSLTPDTLAHWNYHEPFGKEIDLDYPVLDDSRVWVIRNGRMLQSSIDYKLNHDFNSVILADMPSVDDVYTILTFSNNIVRKSFSFMQFKDMLNRTHYKRLRRSARTTLANELHYYDTEVVVTDDRAISLPNRNENLPGILEINGERIEYFVKTGNVLSQLRRGTLGTGTRSVYPAGTVVQDIGITETIPYKDETIIEKITSNGVDLEYDLSKITPVLDATTLVGTSWYRNTIPSSYGQGNDIEVFAGGWNVSGEWAASVSYTEHQIVIYGSYTYMCISNHTSSEFFTDLEAGNWKFFVGNIRLKKKPYKIHNSYIHNESPEGDVQFEADFSVNGTQSVRLTTPLTTGTEFTVVKTIGQVWETPNTSLASTNNAISKFIKVDLEIINNITDVNGDLFADENGNPLEL